MSGTPLTLSTRVAGELRNPTGFPLAHYPIVTDGVVVASFPGMVVADSTGAAINPARDESISALNTILTSGTLKTAQSGSTGLQDASGAPPSTSGLTLLATLPATSARLYAEVQNQSASVLQLVKDDGNGANQTTILIDSKDGNATNVPGGGWSSHIFKGRIRVYGPAGSQFAAYQD